MNYIDKQTPVMWVRWTELMLFQKCGLEMPHAHSGEIELLEAA